MMASWAKTLGDWTIGEWKNGAFKNRDWGMSNGDWKFWTLDNAAWQVAMPLQF